jgi:hypothetical protein
VREEVIEKGKGECSNVTSVGYTYGVGRGENRTRAHPKQQEDASEAERRVMCGKYVSASMTGLTISWWDELRGSHK